MIVEGRVQGVGYRWFVLRHARALGLAGWVRNADDGSVVLEAQGEPQALDSLESLLREGPRLSRVHRVTVCEAPIEVGESFRIAF